jgi:conjugal transfer pilus assembly protein TrbC
MRKACFLVCLLFSESYATDFAAIERNAKNRAHAYAHELQQIAQSNAASIHEGQEVYPAFKTQEPVTTHLKKVSQVLVFLSFSMPKKSLEAWLVQCKQAGATPVIRGLIHHSFQETMTVIQSLSQKTGMGMQLDPILFKTFEIEVVPAVVSVKDSPDCPSNMNCKSVDYDKLYGDVSLDYALEKMSSDDPALHRMILRLRGDFA